MQMGVVARSLINCDGGWARIAGTRNWHALLGWPEHFQHRVECDLDAIC